MDINEVRDMLDGMDSRNEKRFDSLSTKFDNFDIKFSKKIEKNREVNEAQHKEISATLISHREDFVDHKARVETRTALIAAGISMFISAIFLVIAVIKISNNIPV